jgi:uncharacterized membrane protein (UPF0182 family)
MLLALLFVLVLLLLLMTMSALVVRLLAFLSSRALARFELFAKTLIGTIHATVTHLFLDLLVVFHLSSFEFLSLPRKQISGANFPIFNPP